MTSLDEQRAETLQKLRKAQDAAADSEKKGWGNFIAAQEALVQQVREARISLGQATSSIDRITALIKDSLGDSKEKITTAVTALDKASNQVEKHQREIAAEKAGDEAAEAELKRLLGVIDERKKELATALGRVTRLQADAMAAAMGTTPDATRKAWAFIEELTKAKEKLSDLLSKAQMPEQPEPWVSEQNLTAYIKAVKQALADGYNDANADLANYGKGLTFAQYVPEDMLAEYLKLLLEAKKKAGDKLSKAKNDLSAEESARRHADEVRKTVVQ